jgi:hypothetical protein
MKIRLDVAEYSGESRVILHAFIRHGAHLDANFTNLDQIQIEAVNCRKDPLGIRMTIENRVPGLLAGKAIRWVQAPLCDWLYDFKMVQDT